MPRCHWQRGKALRLRQWTRAAARGAEMCPVEGNRGIYGEAGEIGGSGESRIPDRAAGCYGVTVSIVCMPALKWPFSLQNSM